MPSSAAKTFRRCVETLVADIATWAEEAGATVQRGTVQKQDEHNQPLEVASLRFGTEQTQLMLSPTPPSGFGEHGSVRVECRDSRETIAILHLRDEAGRWEAIVLGDEEGYRQSGVNASLIDALLNPNEPSA